ncbi:MAG TPA: VOC family protein [Thermoplasmata archaeon]|jgi:catechol 2,3-dioxygenase-like lactoylglutathione lyase family enzyme
MARRPVQFLYSGIRVRDLRRSLTFYRALGFRVRTRGRMGHGGQWVHLVFPGSRHALELNFYPKGNRFYEPFRKGTEFDHFGFYVSDVAAWSRRALRAGGKSVEDFVDGKSRLVYVNDPNGVCLEAFGPARPRRRARVPRRS